MTLSPSVSTAPSNTTQLAFQFGGKDMIADLSGAAFIPADRLLLLADLHLEKGSSFSERHRGASPLDTMATLDIMDRLIRLYDPTRVVCLGDSFHDIGAASRLTVEDTDRLNSLIDRRHWTWVLGNHDPALPDRVAGQRCGQVTLGRMLLVHEARHPAPSGMLQVCGHFHPKVTIRSRGRRLWRRCFVKGDDCLILPSIGAYTGGLSVGHPEIRKFCTPGTDLLILGQNRLHRANL